MASLRSFHYFRHTPLSAVHKILSSHLPLIPALSLQMLECKFILLNPPIISLEFFESHWIVIQCIVSPLFFILYANGRQSSVRNVVSRAECWGGMVFTISPPVSPLVPPPRVAPLLGRPALSPARPLTITASALLLSVTVSQCHMSQVRAELSKALIAHSCPLIFIYLWPATLSDT